MSNATSVFQFKGGAAEYLGVGILAAILTICTFGLAFPWAYIMLIRYDTENIVVDGKRLTFTGSGFGLIGNWIKWWFFCLITLGIYSFWVYPNLQKWRWSNTVFEA